MFETWGSWADAEIDRYLDYPSDFVYFRKGTSNLSSKTVEYLHGKLFWAKVLPDQLTDNYAKDGKEWTVEFEPDAEGVEVIKKHKLADRLKNKHEGRGAYLTLKVKQFRADGEANRPIKIVEADSTTPWDDRRIGNGTEADVKLDIRDYGKGKFPGIYLQAIRVLDLVPYEGGAGFAPLAEDDPRLNRNAEFRKDFGLDDEDLDDPID